MRQRSLRYLLVVSLFTGALCSAACLGNMPWRMRMVKAKSSLRKIETAQKAHKSSTGRYGTFQELVSKGLIVGDLSKGVSDGYRYVVRADQNTYEALAIPEGPDEKNLPAYLLDSAGRMHQSDIGEKEVTVDDQETPEN